MPENTRITCQRLQAIKLQTLIAAFPIVALIGPRQSGKTTLARTTLPEYQYITLEDLDNRAFAESDPRGFLAQYNVKTIIDEAQRAPNLFSYIQTSVDEFDTPGQYLLTGSAHLTLLEELTQSLAGRAAILKLLPLSIAELQTINSEKQTWEEQLYTGFYPRLYKHNLDPIDWYPNYIQTYLEKDVREMTNIRNLLTFKKFLSLCAGRHGQLLDITGLSNDCGIARQTVTEWLSVLEASFLIYFLSPYHKNFNKRLMKTPKLYFYDTGLVCSLLKIENHEQLKTHYLKGAIFEGYAITEIIKHRYNQGLEAHCYYWRERNGKEVDCIIEKANHAFSVEIKSGKTISQDFFKGLKHWQALSEETPTNSYLIYGGELHQTRQHAQVLGWKNLETLLQNV